MGNYQRIAQITLLRTSVHTITVKMFECFAYVCTVVLSRLRILFNLLAPELFF